MRVSRLPSLDLPPPRRLRLRWTGEPVLTSHRWTCRRAGEKKAVKNRHRAAPVKKSKPPETPLKSRILRAALTLALTLTLLKTLTD